MRVARVASLAVAALVLGASSAAAQATCGATNAVTATCSPTGTQVTVTVQRIVRVTVTPTSATLTAPTDADFATLGTVLLSDIDLQAIVVRANTSWSLTATASAWTAPYAKAIGDAGFSTTSGAPFTVFTGGAQTLGTGTATNGTTINLSYQVFWALTTDIPGTYTLPVAFTVSST